jgi:hypothetical protein
MESFATRKRIFRAVSSRECATTQAAESGYRGFSTTAVTVVNAPFRDFARILHSPSRKLRVAPMRAMGQQPMGQQPW